MNEVWNLQRMYTGFDDPEFAGDLAEFQRIVKEAQAFAGQLKDMEPLEGLRRGIALEENFMELAEKLVGYAVSGCQQPGRSGRLQSGPGHGNPQRICRSPGSL